MRAITFSTRAVLLSAVLAYSVASETHAARPNVLFVVVDDLGYGELGCYGGREIPTPHLDSLAASGVRFTNGYVTAPFCAASRAALLTGRYQTRFGFEFNPIGAKNVEPGIGLPVRERTVADHLRDAGYATALVGKWHLGGTAPFHPLRRGFDEFFGFLHEGHTYAPAAGDVASWWRRTALPDGTKGRWTSADGRTTWSTHMGHREPDYDADNPLLRGGQPVDERANLTDAFTREACDFLERHRQQPFFLCLSYNAVHSPLQAPTARLNDPRLAHLTDIHRRLFAALLTHLDESVGTVLAKLRELKLDERTLVVFLSDNGGPTKELTSSNAPLRGGKGELWEGGIRVPLLMSWKGSLPAGKVVHAPISSLDASATALGAANIPLASLRLDGVDLRPLLAEPARQLPRETLFWRVGKKHALRHASWKMIRDADSPWRLYDLSTDIGEATDVAAANASRVRELSARWNTWNAEQAEPLWK